MGLKEFIRNNAGNLGVWPSKEPVKRMAEENIYTDSPIISTPNPDWTPAQVTITTPPRENYNTTNIMTSDSTAPSDMRLTPVYDVKDIIEEWEMNYNLGCAMMAIYKASCTRGCDDVERAIAALERELRKRREKMTRAPITSIAGGE